MNTVRFDLALFFLVSLAVQSTFAVPLGSEWTFQARLDMDESPVNGMADFEFRLWDDPVAGAQQGPTLTFDGVGMNPPSVNVVDGLFTVQLDFGATLFDGNGRWLEIAVRFPAGGGAYTTLSPRQPITATPYALQTRGIFTNDALQVGIGTTAPGGKLHVRGSGNASVAGGGLLVIEHVSGNQLAFDGNDLLARNNGNPNALHLNKEGGNVLLVENGVGNVGIGTTNPQHRLHVQATSGPTVFAVNTGADVGGYFVTSGAGTGARGETETGIGVFGFAAANSGIAVQGVTPGADSIAVHGRRDSLQGTAPAILGETSSRDPNAVAVKGSALGQAQGATYGVLGESRASQDAVGVRGECVTSGGTGGPGTNPTCTGVEGEGERYGVHGIASNPANGEGVYGEGWIGVHGRGGGMNGAGVSGEADFGSTATGVRAAGPGGGAPAIVAENSGGTGLLVELGADTGIHIRDAWNFGIRAEIDFSNPNGVAGSFRSDGTAIEAHGLVEVDGAVIIGSNSLPAVPPGVRLAVDGKIMAEELEVQLSQDWPDYVFADDYDLPRLTEVEAFVREHRHLPNVPSAQDVARDGINVGAMQATLLQKVEELTLYVVQLNRELDEVRAEKRALEMRLSALEAGPTTSLVKAEIE